MTRCERSADDQGNGGRKHTLPPYSSSCRRRSSRPVGPPRSSRLGGRSRLSGLRHGRPTRQFRASELDDAADTRPVMFSLYKSNDQLNRERRRPCSMSSGPSTASWRPSTRPGRPRSTPTGAVTKRTTSKTLPTLFASQIGPTLTQHCRRRW